MGRKLGWLLAAVLVALVASAQPAAAHNMLASSEPASGERLSAPPQRIVLRFTKAAPVATASADWIDASGSRTPLQVSQGEDANTIAAPAPGATSGRATIEWRLVGQDGHVLKGEIAFNVTGAPTMPAPSAAASAPSSKANASAAPDALRSLLRIASFLGMTVLGGVIVLALIWTEGWAEVINLRRAMVVGLGLVAAGAIGQLLVLGADISQQFPWPGWDGLRAARRTDVGLALMARALLVAGLGALIFARWRASIQVRWRLAAGSGVALAATFAWAGHARSMRWSSIGLPLDVVHHVAAAAWLGGLFAVGLLVIRHVEAPALLSVVRRYSTVAGFAVGALVVTGVFQAIRLIGSPLALVTTTHGRWLLLKATVLGLMLYVADVNRQRVRRRFGSPESASAGQRFALRRVMLTESALGVAVLVITAFLVVSTPGSASDAPASLPTAATLSGDE